MTQQTSKYVVAYGFNDKFHLEEKEAKALVKAREEGKLMIKFPDKVLSTNFTWLVPEDQTNDSELDSRELKLCENVAEWLSRPINELDWSYDSALSYSKKLMRRTGWERVYDLWTEYANGAYPSVKKFLSEAKEESGIEELDNNLLE